MLTRTRHKVVTLYKSFIHQKLVAQKSQKTN